MDKILIHKPYFDDDDRESILHSINTTFVSGDGPDCRMFEKHLCDYTAAKFGLFTNSATTALETIIRALDLPKDSDVIVPAFTFTSTALAPLYNNLNVKFCDVDPESGNITIESLKPYITEKTSCVIPVDYAGVPVDIDPILDFCNQMGIAVIQDCAQSIGSFYKNSHTGIKADAAVFSFHGTKNMTTGEGGAIITNNEKLFEKCKLIRDKGTNKYSFLTDNKTKGYYEYQVLGNSYVQSNINACLGISQLKKLDLMNEKRERIAIQYDLLFDQLGIKRIPKGNHTTKYNHHLYGILIDERFELMEYLINLGINSNVHYTPMYQNSLYSNFGSEFDFPGSYSFYKKLLRIPIYPSLSEKEINYITTGILNYYG
jgi:dTDP-4-amino-4,6-dideoxygalactose transaminase